MLNPDGVVAYLLFDSKALLILRDDKPDILNPARWALPSGGIDPDEDPCVAIKREMLEELGIILEFEQIGVSLGSSQQKNYHFAARLTGAHIREIALKEGCAFGFFSVKAMAALHSVGDAKGGLAGTAKVRLMANPEAATRFLEEDIPLPSDYFTSN